MRKLERMFENDLSLLPTADLLESAAEHRAEINRLEARLLEHAQIFADHHHPSARPERSSRLSWEGRKRAVVLGGDGCPEIAEFAPAEFGVMLGISAGAAARYIGQALALRHRFPFIWAKVQAGEATPWRACKITTACADLSAEAAASVDKRLAPIVDSVTPYRLEKIVKAAAWHADPDGARAAADEKARERGVYIGHRDDHGTKKVYVRAASGDVIRFDATITGIADALRALGDTSTLSCRRAKAIGIIADPHYTAELLLQAREQHLASEATETDQPAVPREPEAVHERSAGEEDLLQDWTEPTPSDDADREAPYPSDVTQPDPLDLPTRDPVDPQWPAPPREPEDGVPLDLGCQRALDARLAQIRHDAHNRQHPHPAGANRLRPGQTTIYVHLTDHTLASGDGVVRVEGVGPLLASQLSELVGHGPYTVKPVIDLNDAVSVDAYEIPTRIRERVQLIHPVELFPYGNRETDRAIDLDHIRPYDTLGPPGQTSVDNLAPLRRFSHRVKTHARGWKVRRIDAKTIEWRTPNGFTFHVDPTGTHRAHSDPS